MKNKYLLILSAVVLTGSMCFGQTTSDDGYQRSLSTQGGKQFPQVNAEGKVRVRIAAPQAQSVQIDIGGAKYDLKKDAEGVWIGESAPQDVGFHYYQLNIDGASVPDPGSLYYYGASRWGSGIEIPSDDQDFFARKNVPHGQLRETFYYSNTSESIRRVYIYTPPGYDKGNKSYPVLYLQHGGGEDETGWGSQGYTAMIMDNLIAEGKAKPFIIVMENGSGGGGQRGGQGARPAAGAGQGARPGQGPGGGMNMAGGFERVLLDDLIPFIESNFRVISNQANRAMAGLSMGGMQTRSIVINNPDKFSYIGLFSSGTFEPNQITDINSFKKNVKLMFMSFGGTEGGAARIPAAAEEWNKIGIKGVSYVSPGTGHEWHSWRRSLYQFAPLLFK